MIVQDMITLILTRVVPKSAPSPPSPPVTQFAINNRSYHPLLSRDAIIRRALEDAKRSRPTHRQYSYKDMAHTTDIPHTKINLNRNSKIPPIKVAHDPDIQELIRSGRSKGYSEAALVKTRYDSHLRRLFVPSKEENDTVGVWRLEEQYRASINKLKGYTSL